MKLYLNECGVVCALGDSHSDIARGRAAAGGAASGLL